MDHPISHLICAVGASSAGIKWLVYQDEHSSSCSKGRVDPKTGHGEKMGSSYSSTLPLTSALDGVV